MVLSRVIGGIWIAAGMGVALLGVLTIVAALGGGLTVGGAGAFARVVLALVPLSMLLGPFWVVCGVKLMSGRAWARVCLEISSWAALLCTIAYAVISLGQDWEIARNDAIAGTLAAVALGILPLAVMIFALRTDAMKR